jgi:hypothetical protein
MRTALAERPAIWCPGLTPTFPVMRVAPSLRIDVPASTAKLEAEPSDGADRARAGDRPQRKAAMPRTARRLRDRMDGWT